MPAMLELLASNASTGRDVSTSLFVIPSVRCLAQTIMVQYVGEVSPDNLGWVWQSNVFSHLFKFFSAGSLPCILQSNFNLKNTT
jgi:hypothetical protein